MKKGLKISLLILSLSLFLTACNSGETVTEKDIAPTAENSIQLENEVYKDNKNSKNDNSYSEVNYDWWENKRYVSTQTGGYFYGFRYSKDGEPFFTFGNCCVSIAKGNAEIMEEEYFGTIISYTFQTTMRRGNSIVNDEYWVFYYTERDYVETASADGTYSDRFYYDDTYQSQDEGNVGGNDDYLTFPLAGNTNYECFETETGEDVMITIDIQNDTPYIIFPEAVWVELEVNGKGDSWEFINPYFTEERVYTTVSIQDNEIAITTNETFMYDGTYIQLPDIGADGE